MRCVGSHRQPGPPSEPRRAGRCGSAHVADPGPVTTLRTRRDTPRHRRRPWGSPVRSAFPPRRRPCATSMIQSVGRGWRRECDARCHGHVTSQGGGRTMPELRIAGARALMRVAAVLTGVSVAALGLGVPAARAETSPAVGQPLTVSADGLPTWQINGVVWSQAVVGNTVYVAGNFTRARPPGVAAGGARRGRRQLRLRLRHHHGQPRRVVQSPAERPGERRVGVPRWLDGVRRR